MDTTILAFAAAILAVGAIPFAAMAWQRRQRLQKLRNAWHDWVKRLGLEPGQLNCSGHLALGLDAHNKWFLVLRQQGPTPTYSRIELSLVKRCQLSQTYLHQQGPDGPYTLTDTIGLQFEYLTPARASDHVLLYDSHGQHQTLADELELAREWQQKLTALLLTL